jgi:hypothetical protein
VPASSEGWSPTLSITGQAKSNYAVTFDLRNVSSALIDQTYGYLTNATSTYALMITDLNGGTNLALGSNYANPFVYGAAYPFGGDFVFSQIIVAPGDQAIVPIPEASTVASMLGATFVAALVGFRLHQRRQFALAPVAVV